MAISNFKVLLNSIKGEEPRYISLEESVNRGFVSIKGNSLVAIASFCEIIQYEEKKSKTYWERVAPKPPLGIMPKNVWVATRNDEIWAAIERYREVGRPIPEEWLTELIEHNRYQSTTP